MDDRNLIWHGDSNYLYVFQFGKLYTHTGVFINGKTKSAFLIDAPFGSYEFLRASVLRGIFVEALLITHCHWDHIGDDHLFKGDGAKVYAHKDDRIVIENPKALIPYAGSDMGLTPCVIDEFIDDNSFLTLAGIGIYSRSVPGHCPGGMIFYLGCAGVVFVGDTLFRNGIGRYDFPGGDKKLLISGIKGKILPLPGDTIVVPGHGEFTTVAYERENNKYLK
ncbi:MAG: MBL fold metallo-hydrolase [Puniceicoccales bacterium]|jgi:glyoxylase-like metal-dependent hydrolase (beta-lactamase superfamily II)|nr:MBL fold metallo-hydrolase [Puniceicoccales bacterium]